MILNQRFMTRILLHLDCAHIGITLDSRKQKESFSNSIYYIYIYIYIRHGYRDYIGSFEHDSNVLAGYGYTSMGFDHRGFGQSEGKHLLIEDFESLIADSMIYYKMIKEEYPSIPIYLLGQSMGGLTCFILAHRYPQLWAGIIALSPAIAPPVDLYIYIYIYM